MSDEERQILLTHVAEFKASDMTQMEYCKTHNLSFSKLSYWLRKGVRLPKEKKPLKDHDDAAKHLINQGYKGFAETEVKSPEMEIVLKDGTRLIFYSQVDPEYLKKILQSNY